MNIKTVRVLEIPFRVSRLPSGELQIAPTKVVRDTVDGRVIQLSTFTFSKLEADLWFATAASNVQQAADWAAGWAHANWTSVLPAGMTPDTRNSTLAQDGTDYLGFVKVNHALLPGGPRLEVDGIVSIERAAVPSDIYLEAAINGSAADDKGPMFARVIAVPEGDYVLERTDVSVGADGFFRATLAGTAWEWEWQGTGWDVLNAANRFAVWMASSHPDKSEWLTTEIIWTSAPSVGFRVRRLRSKTAAALKGSTSTSAQAQGLTSGYTVTLGLGRAGEKMLVGVSVKADSTKASGNVGFNELLALAQNYVPEGDAVNGFQPIHGPNLTRVADSHVNNSAYLDLGANATRPDMSTPDVGYLGTYSRELAAKLAKARDQAAYASRRSSMFKKLFKWLLLIVIVLVIIYFPSIMAFVGEWFSVLFTGSGLAEATLAAVMNLPWWVGGAVALGSAYLIAPETTSELVHDIGKAAGDVAGTIAKAGGSAISSLFSGLAPLAFGAVALILLLRKKDKSTEPARVEVSTKGALNDGAAS